jgi:glycosyltransferase involved in cell wall biosynthesis
VDEKKFVPGRIGRAEARSQLGLREDDFVVLLARRFEAKNGLRYFARALGPILASVPNAIALFCGPDYDGIELSATQGILAESRAGRRARFEGSVPNSEMFRYYAAADISVLPSLIEATSIAALESMASGVPVVATSVGGLPQLIDDGRTGILVPPRNPAALAEAVVRLWRDDALRESLAVSAIDLVHHQFAWERIAQLTEEQYCR